MLDAHIGLPILLGGEREISFAPESSKAVSHSTHLLQSVDTDSAVVGIHVGVEDLSRELSKEMVSGLGGEREQARAAHSAFWWHSRIFRVELERDFEVAACRRPCQ